ncbi:hypothetical protein MSAN_01411500 [Mycena sanguinolenta]|uniref:Uncharacterized protein n=1 Tax=Mycena sanguinolenta TaxID=230812 RepID=A0A8H6YAU2_9AGAR|nr:hypothetical protein MSAN_01411500 [Mycena sanguinolenta]
MSLSMDDLCASLSSSHVGQEAIDLAALQVQLAQTLFCQSMAASSAAQQQRQGDYAQPCNTPTGRTPSASFSWSPMAMIDSSLQPNPPITPRRNADEHVVRDEMEEDERMVEDLLIPTSPMSSPMSAKSHTPATPQSQQTSPMYPASPETSLFTTTDPFYIAQSQAAQHFGVSPPSVFSQTAFPSQQSPFLIHSNFQPHPAQNPLSLDTHSLLMAATSSFTQ